MLNHYLGYAKCALSMLPRAAFWLSSNKTGQIRSIGGRKESSATRFLREEREETRLEIAIRKGGEHFMNKQKNHYDKYGNKTGHTEDDTNKKIHYDKYWNKIGYTIQKGDIEIHYDTYWNLTGFTILREDTETHYDTNWSKTGYTEKDKDEIYFRCG